MLFEQIRRHQRPRHESKLERGGVLGDAVVTAAEVGLLGRRQAVGTQPREMLRRQAAQLLGQRQKRLRAYLLHDAGSGGVQKARARRAAPILARRIVSAHPMELKHKRLLIVAVIIVVILALMYWYRQPVSDKLCHAKIFGKMFCKKTAEGYADGCGCCQ